MALKSDFKDAQSRIRQLSRSPDVNELLDLYSLYKQSVMGDVTGPAPAALDFKARAKHDAWTRRLGMTRNAAMTAYVELVAALTSKYG